MCLFLNRLLFPIIIIFIITLSGCNKDQMNNEDNNEIINIKDIIGNGGNLTWLKTIGGSLEEIAVSAVITQDGNIAVLAYTNSVGGDIPTTKQTTDLDLWLIKLNPDGDILWSKIYGDIENEFATKLNSTSDGGFIISGYSSSNNCGSNSNNGRQDYWLLKLDSNGNQQWCKNYGFDGFDRAFDIFETNDGGYFASGYLDVTESGGLGNDNRNIQENYSKEVFWVIKMDANGDFIWRRYFGGSNIDKGFEAIQTLDNGFIIVGISDSGDIDINDKKGMTDAWAVKINVNGDKEWTKSYGGSYEDEVYSITSGNDGNYFITGVARSNDLDLIEAEGNGNGNLWVLKINNQGELLKHKRFGGFAIESGNKIKSINNNNLAIAGFTYSNEIDVTSNKGRADTWLLILDIELNLLFQKTVGGSNLDFAYDVLQLSDGSIIVVGKTDSNNGNIITNNGGNDVLIFKLN